MEEANNLPRSPLPLSHTKWQVGRSFVIHSPHGSPSSCHEWMSSRCQSPGSAMDTVLASWLVLVAWHGHSDAEGDQQLWVMHPSWRQSYQSHNMQLIIITTPLELLHVDFTSIEITWWSWINPQTWWTFWSFVTTFQDTSWHIWPLLWWNCENHC